MKHSQEVSERNLPCLAEIGLSFRICEVYERMYEKRTANDAISSLADRLFDLNSSFLVQQVVGVLLKAVQHKLAYFIERWREKLRRCDVVNEPTQRYHSIADDHSGGIGHGLWDEP